MVYNVAKNSDRMCNFETLHQTTTVTLYKLFSLALSESFKHSSPPIFSFLDYHVLSAVRTRSNRCRYFGGIKNWRFDRLRVSEINRERLVQSVEQRFTSKIYQIRIH